MFDTLLPVFFTAVFLFRISATSRNMAQITESKFHLLKVYILNIRNCITSVIQCLARDSFEILLGWCGIYREASHTSLIFGTVQIIQLTRYISFLFCLANGRVFGLRLLQTLLSRQFGMNRLLHGRSLLKNRRFNNHRAIVEPRIGRIVKAKEKLQSMCVTVLCHALTNP